MGRLSRGGSADRGAAALEFALVVPVLVVLVFGMIDYGLYFTDSLGARDGARAAVRQAAVADFPASGCAAGYVATGGDSELNALACLAGDQAGAIGGDTYARIWAPTGWVVGENITVCVAIVENGVTGFTPMPNDSTVRSKLSMRIEQPTSPRKTNGQVGEAQRIGIPAPPSNLWDNWCV
jgi:TadE-like protein